MLPRREAATVPPPAHPLDSTIEVLTELASAVRAVSIEVKDGMGKIADNMNALGGRIDGQSRAVQELAKETRGFATEIRAFVSDKERIKGRVIMLEEIEKERREREEIANGNHDAE